MFAVTIGVHLEETAADVVGAVGVVVHRHEGAAEFGDTSAKECVVGQYANGRLDDAAAIADDPSAVGVDGDGCDGGGEAPPVHAIVGCQMTC